MKTTKLLSAASGAVLALGVVSSGLAPGAALAQGYGAAPPPPPSYQPPSTYDVPDTSVLKVCKAGVKIPPGVVFSFYTRPSGGKESVPIPAGPAPAGYCQVVGTYRTGAEVELREYLPRGYGIISIKTVPGEAEISQNLADGSVRLRLGRGVTEVTVLQEPRWGWIEICKEGGRTGVIYEYTFGGMNGPETHSTVAGACTPAIQVPMGQLVVTESPAQGMTGGETWPSSRLVKVDVGRGQVTAMIPQGDITTQTIITFKNRPERTGY